MPKLSIKFDAAIAVIIFASLEEVFINRPFRVKYRDLARAYLMTHEENVQLKGKAKYLLHKLEENDIPLDDFDLIVLTHDIPPD